MRRAIALMAAATALSPAPAQPLRPDQTAFRALYQQLVETNTTLSAGSCTAAADEMAAHLKAAGLPAADVTVFATPDHPKEGGLVARLPGSDPSIKPMLLLAHLDVVEANRADWTRDPFKLVEENGFFYARGSSDDKAMAAVWVDTLARLKAAHVVPQRTIKLALTCGEESTAAFNGAQWLSETHPDWVGAAFALNEGGGGLVDKAGKPQMLSLQVGEKHAQNFTLTTTNPGGHSSRPTRANAIYQLSHALDDVEAYDFPIHLNDVTRAFFTRTATLVGGDMGRAMTRLVADPGDRAADAIVSADPSYHSLLRTTCVATLLKAGHAENALPQHAEANVNCRIVPGETVEQTRATLVRIIGDAGVTVTANQPLTPVAKAPPLDPTILAPAEAVAAARFPGLPVVPTMSTGATDGIFLEAIGIPVYGVPGILAEPDFNGIHGLNEHLRVRSLYQGRDYLFDLVRRYAIAG
jgi:acetylornithine deacetylase/succinyl-diaminopimelate desuccinylase-like protein